MEIAIDPAKGPDVSVASTYKVDIGRIRQLVMTYRMETERWYWLRCELCLRLQVFQDRMSLELFKNRGVPCYCGHKYDRRSEVGDFPAGRIMVWDDVRIS